MTEKVYSGRDEHLVRCIGKDGKPCGKLMKIVNGAPATCPACGRTYGSSGEYYALRSQGIRNKEA